MNEIWEELYEAAMGVVCPRAVSSMVEVGSVAAAVESLSGKIYVGICVDTACTLGICAERNAIFQMLTNGENGIRRVLAVDDKGRVLFPCGACRELMAQLMPERYQEIEVMMDYEQKRIVTLGALLPEWWGKQE